VVGFDVQLDMAINSCCFSINFNINLLFIFKTQYILTFKLSYFIAGSYLIYLMNFGLWQHMKLLREHNFFCYISNLEHRLFSISPLLHLPLILSDHAKSNTRPPFHII